MNVTMESVRLLDDEQLLELRHKCANRVSEFNAAEGNWSRETPFRLAAQAELWHCDNELRVRNLQPRKGNYLL